MHHADRKEIQPPEQAVPVHHGGDRELESLTAAGDVHTGAEAEMAAPYGTVLCRPVSRETGRGA
ncbi:hypothetical protein GCM10010339_33210 [Streptomyces alanosinicus]|uniref:Uncharacterized protein n=1 Tax=Streptomyces alanosinicus TaxID=68171 RepID=A0A918YH87_9ACTN|nr:hypothetical protein GCM10010339_33210 [Streptomyces alanosinicus]